jgi:hypothetical protein
MSEKVHELQTKMQISMSRYLIAASPFLVISAFSEIDGTRDTIPEPFDFMDHIYNAGISVTAGFATSIGIGLYYNTRPKYKGISKNQFRTRLILGASFVGLALNSLTETKLGLNLLESLDINLGQTTPDTIDLAYGVIAAGAAAAVIPTFTQEPLDP